MISWNFIDQVIKAKGFPIECAALIQRTIPQGTSRVILNSVAGKNIKLSKGVWQGDPMAPYLFIIAMDFLCEWIIKLTHDGLLQPPFSECRTCLLYADDTLLLLKP
jgi:Reverse transcriptase (RNA-dependent DNA polymerase)